MAKKKTENVAEVTPDVPEKKAYVRGQSIIVAKGDAQGIFLKMLSDTTAKVVNGRNQFEVMEVAELDQLNK